MAILLRPYVSDQAPYTGEGGVSGEVPSRVEDEVKGSARIDSESEYSAKAYRTRKCRSGIRRVSDILGEWRTRARRWR